jgi:hypothetical protein
MLSILAQYDWPASLAWLEREMPLGGEWENEMGLADLIAWNRALSAYKAFLEVELLQSFSAEKLSWVEALEQRLNKIEKTAREKALVRNLTLLHERRSIEEMTKPGRRDPLWRRRHGRQAELSAEEENAVIEGSAQGLSPRAMARAFAHNLRPLSDGGQDLQSWLKDVALLRRSPGRPRGQSTGPAATSNDEVRFKRLIERCLQASREMEKVVDAGRKIGKDWPICRS